MQMKDLLHTKTYKVVEKLVAAERTRIVKL